MAPPRREGSTKPLPMMALGGVTPLRSTLIRPAVRGPRHVPLFLFFLSTHSSFRFCPVFLPPPSSNDSVPRGHAAATPSTGTVGRYDPALRRLSSGPPLLRFHKCSIKHINRMHSKKHPKSPPKSTEIPRVAMRPLVAD